MSKKDAVLAALKSVEEPQLKRSIVDLGMVKTVEVGETDVAKIEIQIRNPAYSQKADVQSAVEKSVGDVDGINTVEVKWAVETSGREIKEDDPVPQVRNVILVMSGKGGVGKSTVATNLALALSRMGTRVGLLDADIYGPSIPTMLGINGRPLSSGDKIQPLSRFGVKLMSMGFLLEDPKSAVVWRGPMLHGALLQFLKDVDWGPLDYLLLDLPPGTGDVALTLAQRVRTNGAVIVTTPQEVAVADVYKSVSMAHKVGIPVLGVVENQSYFVCGTCDTKHQLFGEGGGEKVAELAEAPLLGQIPLNPTVREWGDAGTPVVQASPGSDIAQAFFSVAEKLAEAVDQANSATTGLKIDRSGGVNRHLPVQG